MNLIPKGKKGRMTEKEMFEKEAEEFWGERSDERGGFGSGD